MKIALPTDWFQTLLRLPESMKTDTMELEDNEGDVLMQTIDKAIGQLEEFRQQEGVMLQKLFTQKIDNIASLLKEVEPYEQERVEKIKVRIHEALSKIEFRL